MASNGNLPDFLSGILYRLKRLFGRNLEAAAFCLFFLYMIISAAFYVNSRHIVSYQVVQGPLSRNETYTGLSIREESIVKAETSGYITYYAREGNKINAQGAVYGLSPNRTSETETRLSQEDLSKVRESMMNFSKNFNASKFINTYSFKYQLEGSILQYAGVTGQSATPRAVTYEQLSGQTEDGETQNNDQNVVYGLNNTVTYGDQTISKSLSDGIVLYSEDGYTGKTIETITKQDFDQNSYHETDLKTREKVRAGDDIYTIITDERWSLLIPLSDKQAVKLHNRKTIRVKFLKDGMTQSGDFSIINIDGGKYGKIDFNKGLVRYATDRFLDIELVTNTVTGLKIPLSSIVTKEFYLLPSTFAIQEEGSTEETFYLGTRGKDGKTVTTIIRPTIYFRQENPKETTLGTNDTDQPTTYSLFVDKKTFQEGDYLVSKDGKRKYNIGDTGVLEGVYCINQGYAVFRRIEILDQNEEYAIVRKGTNYGLVRYDHIVRNANTVNEEDILY